MRRFILSAVLMLGSTLFASAIPIPGYEAEYQRVLAACTFPTGSVALCQAAIDAYAVAIVPVAPLEEAALSFRALREAISIGNIADAAFGTQIDDIFAVLLFEPASIGPLASP